MKRLLSGLALLSATALLGGTAAMAADPVDVGDGKIAIIKAAKLAKFIAKPVTTFDLPDASNDPTTAGAVVSFVDLGTTPNPTYMTYDLPAAGWGTIGAGGFKYKGAGSPTDPCKVVLVKDKIVKAICKGTAVNIPQPLDGKLGAVLTLGTTKNYCAIYGGTEVKNDATQLKRKTAAAPACTCGASVPSTFTFRNNQGSGNCGTLTTDGGASTSMACNGLFIGSGSGTLVLPEIVPDSEKALVMNVQCCDGETLLLGPSSDSDIAPPVDAANETCTSAGCNFGAPLPLPNPTSVATSTCVFNTYARDVQGELDCGTGAARLDMPLISATFLTGDILLNRCSGGTNPGGRCTAPGPDVACTGGGTCVVDPNIQPCPICNPTTLICNGGQNNGNPCIPDGGQNIVPPLPQFPTSHDCTVSTLVKVGDLPVPFLLSTGTQSDTALPSGTQTRVFCGHCRDVDASELAGAFGKCADGPNVGALCAVTGDCAGGTCVALPCESDADCTGDAREECEQRNEGAFGPGGGANMTITEIGTPAGDLGDFAAHQGTMVSVFCIPPSFNPIIDQAADIPGPGAVSLPGQFDVSSPSAAFADPGNDF